MIRAATQKEVERIAQLMSYCPTRNVKSVASVSDGIDACVLFDFWTMNAVQVHVYAPSMKALFDKAFLREIFTFPFVTADRAILYSVTPADQKGSLAVSAWLGFREKYRQKDGWAPGIDMVLKELRREDCRFLAQDVKSTG